MCFARTEGRSDGRSPGVLAHVNAGRNRRAVTADRELAAIVDNLVRPRVHTTVLAVGASWRLLGSTAPLALFPHTCGSLYCPRLSCPTFRIQTERRPGS
jgi:hypothetical protein